MAQHNQDMQQCIEACSSCHGVCVETIAYCLAQGGKHASLEHITTLMDCAQICETSADFMLRNSALHAYTCRACADVCDRCAVSCDQMAGAEMKRCADECRSCADECRRMSQALA